MESNQITDSDYSVQSPRSTSLFGNPPRGMVAKAETLATELIAQMEANDDWPMTLRWFVNELTMRKGSEDRVGTS